MRLLCRIFGHRIERHYMFGRVGALQCTRCWANTIFRPPGVTDAQVDAVLTRAPAENVTDPNPTGEAKGTWWCYALSFDESVAVDDMTAALDRIESVGNWYTSLPHTIFVVSTDPASKLAPLIKRQSRARQFVLLDVDTDRDGHLPKKTWEFMSNPMPVRLK